MVKNSDAFLQSIGKMKSKIRCLLKSVVGRMLPDLAVFGSFRSNQSNKYNKKQGYLPVLQLQSAKCHPQTGQLSAAGQSKKAAANDRQPPCFWVS